MPDYKRHIIDNSRVSLCGRSEPNPYALESGTESTLSQLDAFSVCRDCARKERKRRERLE